MKIRRKQRQKRTHAGGWVLLCLILALGFIGYCGLKGVSSIIEDMTNDLPDVTNSEAFSYSEKTRIYANDHETLLAEFYLQDQEPVEIDQISPYVLKGTVATEDERFYDHNGIDLMGIARALVNNLRGGSLEGASTITQQLVRNTLLSSEAAEISVRRKVREAELALEMENTYNKDQILLMYLNTINYGDGCYGIEAAAQHYFQKSALDLTLVEAATLIGIPQSPTYNNPVYYPENSTKRRNLVLDRMLSNGVITQEEHDAAQAEPLALDTAKNKPDDGIYKYPYFTSYVRQTLLNQLSFEEVFEGGLSVYTTIDPTLQGYAEEAAQAQYERMDDSGNGDCELSLTCIDPHTGYVLAMIGGRNYRDSEFNLATSESGRQAGSAFKVFTLTAAIEQGINPDTKINCSGGFKDGTWTVENFDRINYGVRSLASATWVSSNTGFARLVTDEDGVKPASILEVAQRMGVSGSTNEGYGAYPALTLGVAQTNTLEMAGAMGTFAAEGVHYDPSCITLITKDGQTLYDNTNPQGTQALTPEVAYAVTRVLEGVIYQPGATSTMCALSSGQIAAGKSGTSENFRDLWFCGYTPQLSCSVWTGADPERRLGSQTWSKLCWRDFMNMALQGYEIQDFATAPDPEYDSPFNKKQAVLDEEAAAEVIAGLNGKSLDEIKAELGDKMSVSEEYNDTVAVGDVISITFSNGSYVVHVSKGKDPAAENISASVSGMSEADAVAALTAAGFGTPAVQYAYSNDVPSGTVISQSASSGKKGDIVTITVSKGAEPAPPPSEKKPTE